MEPFFEGIICKNFRKHSPDQQNAIATNSINQEQGLHELVQEMHENVQIMMQNMIKPKDDEIKQVCGAHLPIAVYMYMYITVLNLILRMPKSNFNFEKRAFFW